MVWITLEDVNCEQQRDSTSCWLSAAKAVLDAIHVKCESIDELRGKYKGKSQEEVGEYSVNAGVGSPKKVLGDYGVQCEEEYDKNKSWTEADEIRLFGRLNTAMTKGVPVICAITSPQYPKFRHAIVVKGANSTLKEILFTDPATGQMKAVSMNKLITAGFLYKKDSLVNLNTGEKKADYERMPDAWAYAYRFIFPLPLASRI